MQLHEFKLLAAELVELVVDDVVFLDNELLVNQPVKLHYLDDLFLLEQDEKVYSVSLINQSNKSIIKNIQMDFCDWVLTKVKNDRVWLSYVEAQPGVRTLDLDIGVTEYFVNQLFEEKAINQPEMSLALLWLEAEFLVNQLTNQLAYGLVYENQRDNEPTLTLVGRKYVVRLMNRNDYWVVNQLTEYRRRHHRVIRLTGQLEFKDASRAAQLRSPSARKALTDSIDSHGSYIQVWESYSQTQWQLVTNQANELGYFQISRFEHVPYLSGQYYLYAPPEEILLFAKRWKSLAGVVQQEIQVSGEIPDWFDQHKENSKTGLISKKEKPWRGKVKKIESNRLLVEREGDRDIAPPFNAAGHSYLFLSINGMLAQRKRQLEALNCIREQRNPLDGLHHLLQGLTVSNNRDHPIAPLSSKVKKLFKGQNPTEQQREAIRISLNTPDVAMIIGPPGTGKTQVITAIQQRIAEEGKDVPIQHQVLLTSYQHDAVDNVVARSNVLGLPAARVGGKSNIDDKVHDNFDRWTKDRQLHIQSVLDQQPMLLLLKQLREECLTLRLGCSTVIQRTLVITTIEQLLLKLSKEKIRLNQEILERWQVFKKPKQTQCYAAELQPIRHVFEALRTTSTSFTDDGPQRCLDAWVRLQSKSIKDIHHEDLQLLEQLSQSYFEKNGVALSQLARLLLLKHKLLDACMPDYRPRILQTKPSLEDRKLMDDLIRDITKQYRKSKSLGYLMVMDEYLMALKVSAESIRQSTEFYTAVLGATCQQAAGEKMQDIKSIADGASIVFDSVVVDEAARASPLDLMIPMAMAKRRLVLVGDHRQLPHMIDDQVEAELVQKQELNEVQEQMLKESLFQRMVESLSRLQEEPDQPKRVVMLDTQFRMHRILGDFISFNFYENKGLPFVKVKSVRPDSDFIHGVTGYEQAVCAWRTVPSNAGRTERRPGGKSLQRVVEAAEIAKEAYRILQDSPHLSVGIISFYSGQRDCIYEQLMDLGVVEKSNFGFVILDEYKTLFEGENRGKERLRIGTVDAFQGKEFDVVLVSQVRTLRHEFKVDEVDVLAHDAALTKVFGFLRVENRLNVAFSRQHSLLIMVGDLELASHPITKVAAPALHALAELCGGEHGLVF